MLPRETNQAPSKDGCYHRQDSRAPWPAEARKGATRGEFLAHGHVLGAISIAGSLHCLLERTKIGELASADRRMESIQRPFNNQTGVIYRVPGGLLRTSQPEQG